MQVYTVSEVAKMCKVNNQTVWRWIKSGKLKAYRLGGTGTYRIKEDDLTGFKAS